MQMQGGKGMPPEMRLLLDLQDDKVECKNTLPPGTLHCLRPEKIKQKLS